MEAKNCFLQQNIKKSLALTDTWSNCIYAVKPDRATSSHSSCDNNGQPAEKSYKITALRQSYDKGVLDGKYLMFANQDF